MVTNSTLPSVIAYLQLITYSFVNYYVSQKTNYWSSRGTGRDSLVWIQHARHGCIGQTQVSVHLWNKLESWYWFSMTSDKEVIDTEDRVESTGSKMHLDCHMTARVILSFSWEGKTRVSHNRKVSRSKCRMLQLYVSITTARVDQTKRRLLASLRSTCWSVWRAAQTGGILWKDVLTRILTCNFR